MKIIISLILSLIFIFPVAAKEKSDVGPNYTDKQIESLLGTIRESIECLVANSSLEADLTYYKAINSVLSNDMPVVLPKIEEIIKKNKVLFGTFLQGMTQALINIDRYTDDEIQSMLKEWRDFSNTKVDMRKSIGYRDSMLEQHLADTFKYLKKCRRWEKSLMGDASPN